MEHPSVIIWTVGCLLACSCQQSNVGSRTYPDAVVALHQVDPAYRPYFAAQNGSNYSLADQRAAYIKAAQTAKGPMPAYESRSSGTRVHRKGSATSSKGSARKSTAKKSSSKQTSAKKTSAKKASAKTATKKRR